MCLHCVCNVKKRERANEGKELSTTSKPCFIYPDPVVARGKRAMFLRNESRGRVARCIGLGKNQGKIVTRKLIKVIGKAKSDFRGSVVNEKGRKEK